MVSLHLLNNPLTFAPQANRIRISSSGCINIIASAKARCSGFVTHSPGILNNRTVNWNRTPNSSILSLLNVNRKSYVSFSREMCLLSFEIHEITGRLLQITSVHFVVNDFIVKIVLWNQKLWITKRLLATNLFREKILRNFQFPRMACLMSTERASLILTPKIMIHKIHEHRTVCRGSLSRRFHSDDT